MRKALLFILLFGIIVGIFGFYYYQRNVYSKEVLKLEILSSEEIQAFEEIEYLVKYKNNGNTTLEEAKLIFQYPQNSFPTSEKSLRVEKTLEDIYPGEEKTVSFKGRLLGKTDEAKQAEAAIKYRPKNLKAFYESKTTFTTKIKSVPLTLELDLPVKIESGKEFKFSINYFSNSDWPFSNLRLMIEYPPFFEFMKSQPKALEKTEWDLPILNKAEGGRVEISGKLSGELQEQKIFKATLGVWQDGEFILLKEAVKGTEILKPLLSIFQQINGLPNYIASPGDNLHYEIFFRNLGEEPFHDLFLVSTLGGGAFDFETIKTENGQFNRGDNSLVWDWRDNSKLRFLGQGEEGKVEFWVNLKKDWSQSSSEEKNFILKNKIILSQAKEEFETKINSKLEISQKGLWQDQIFGNSGSFPPIFGEATTYTIIWQVKNYYNDVRNAKVKAVLPEEVRLTGKIFPENSRLTFDSRSREIVWEIGDLSAWQGVLTKPPEVAFQIAFTPASNPVNLNSEICGVSRVSGEDTWTGTVLEAAASAVTASLAEGQGPAEPAE